MLVSGQASKRTRSGQHGNGRVIRWKHDAIRRGQPAARAATRRAGEARRAGMALADLTVNFTLNNFTILVILGAVAGLVTGQLMKSKGWMVLADLCFGLVGMLVGVFAVGAPLGISHLGFQGDMLMALLGSVFAVVLVHAVAVVRHKAQA